MGLINWIFDIYQQSRIESLHEEVAQTRLRNDSGGVDAQRLERALGELALAVKTIQRLAVAKGLCTAREFQQTMAAIDREDGREDGQAPLRP